MRSSNPDMAKKMDAFETKMNAAIESGQNPMEPAKSISSELGIPMPGKDGGGIGFGKIGMGQKDDDAKTKQQSQWSNYSLRGQQVQNSAL